MKDIYERPLIIKHRAGIANKFGRNNAGATMPSIDGVSVKDLVGRHGSPLFIFSERTVRKNYRDAYRSFSLRYPKVRFAWSYKTNYLDAICRIYHQEGSWAEVVSEHEYAMARRNGVPGDSIIYNGPYKPREALRTAIAEGAQIHLDHFEELFQLEKIAEEENRTVNAALRLNMDTGIHPAWDRFGFNYDNEEAIDAARRIHAGGRLRLNGVHTHIGTCILDPAAYRRAAEKIVAFIKRVESELGFRIEYVDMGGGFPSASTLHEQYAPGFESNPSLDEYAEAVTSALLAAGFSPDRLPTLVLETGRALVDGAGYLATSVVANKRLACGARAVIVDAGVNLAFTSFWYRHTVRTVEEKQGMTEDTVIYGPLCMNIDVLRPSLRLPSLDAGDLLVLGPVGAYNVTQWLQFIRMRPAVVLVGERGETGVIRVAEDISAIKDFERLPDWLERR